MELRPYQEEAVRAIWEHWRDWRRELLVLPTGCGKTVVFNTIAHQARGKVLILAHREELIEQAREKYQRMYGDLPGKIKAGEEDVRRVTVGSVQTMMRRDYAGAFETVIVDEAHHALSDSYQMVLGQFPAAKVLGVTATPDRGDKKSLAAYFEGVAYEYGLRQAVMDGYLAPIVAKTVPITIDTSQIKVSMGDFELSSIAATLEPYLPEIARAIVEEAAERKTVVFCPLVSIAQDLASRIPGALEVNGGSPDRAEILARFDRAGKGAVLCNAMLLTEGWDCPSCDCVVILRPTKVRALYAQMVGRGARLFPGKENLLLLDFLWLSSRHNLCRPASLLTDSEQDAAEVAKKSEKMEIDLLGAVSDTEEARRNALAAALESKSKKKSKMIDPLEIFAILGDVGLADYEPAFGWEEAPATERQIMTLTGMGVDAEGLCKGYASAILDRLISRSKEGLATVKQVRLLRRYGYNAASWTIKQASAQIGQIAANGWKKYG